MDMITLAMAKAYSDKKGGYTEPPKVLMTGTTANPYVVPGDIGLVVGEKYTVSITLDDTITLEAVCKTIGEVKYIGNTSLLDDVEENTGEPFLVVVTVQDGVLCTAAMFDVADGLPFFIYKPEIIHPIDQKYIPAMDSITLNGADGKQYKLTVDASGALAVTAV